MKTTNRAARPNRNVISHSAGRWKSKVRVSAGPCSDGSRIEHFLASSGSCGSRGSRPSLACDGATPALYPRSCGPLHCGVSVSSDGHLTGTSGVTD